MYNLVGEYHFKLDSKGRLSLPSPFRKALPRELFVTQSPESDCLYVFDADGFGTWVESLFARSGGFDSSNRSHVRARTLLNSRAKKVDVDSSGRIGIPQSLRDAAGLEKEVAVVGNTDHFQIWDAKRWDEFVKETDLDPLFTS